MRRKLRRWYRTVQPVIGPSIYYFCFIWASYYGHVQCSLRQLNSMLVMGLVSQNAVQLPQAEHPK